MKAIVYWFLFEFIAGFIALIMGFDGIFVYLAALAGALLSIKFSFDAARAAAPSRSKSTTAILRASSPPSSSPTPPVE